MDWKSLNEEILKAYPFLAKARFGSKNVANHFSMPPLLAVGSLAAINAIDDDAATARLALIFPHSESVACHIAAAASLAAIKKQFDKGLPPLPDLKSGEKVLLDGVDYNYKGEEVINGISFMIFEYKGGIQKVPASERLRVQHSISNRQLTRRDKNPVKSVIDPILSIKLRGNTSLFQTSVILVSAINKTYRQIFESSIADENNTCSKLAHAFGWGSLSDEGEVRIWGSAGRREEPLVLVSSNFAEVCDYVEYNAHKTELIIIDGSSYLKDLASFEVLLNKNIPVIFVLSGKDQDGIQYLKRKKFNFWAWNAEDLAQLCAGDAESEQSPFYGLQKKILSFASFKVSVVECRNPAFDRAFELLNVLRREITEEDYHASQMLDRIYGLFLRVSRLVCVTNTISAKSDKELFDVVEDLKTFRHYIRREILELLVGAVEFLSQGIAALSEENSKPSVLRTEIGKLLAAGNEKICVVLSKSDFQMEKEYLAARFPGNRVVFERNASFKMRDDYDAVILCGYLKRNHMLRIFDEALTSRITILNYPHEKEWTNSVKKQFFGAFDKQGFRNGAVFGKKFRVTIASATPVEEVPQMPALEEFEIKLHEFRKQRILHGMSEDAGGKKEPARCVTFNQGSFAFLTESYSVPVINDLLGGKIKVERIPQKKIKDIQPGDFLLFRERGVRNLIREMADFGLNKSGKSELRSAASRWREALTKIYEANGKLLAKVKAELKKYDCDRNELTIKNWLFDENQIAPGEDSDILAIAAAADDGKLLKDYDNMLNAISQVRGAHIQAARQIAKLLEKRVKGDLGDLAEANAEIKIPGLGKVFIVCVETIDSDLIDVPGHKVNRLLKEKEREDGTNDSAQTVG